MLIQYFLAEYEQKADRRKQAWRQLTRQYLYRREQLLAHLKYAPPSCFSLICALVVVVAEAESLRLHTGVSWRRILGYFLWHRARKKLRSNLNSLRVSRLLESGG